MIRGQEVVEYACGLPQPPQGRVFRPGLDAQHVFERANATGKRVQALVGAKNHAVVMPDADLDFAFLDSRNYQWHEVAIPSWKDIQARAADADVKVCAEMHPHNAGGAAVRCGHAAARRRSRRDGVARARASEEVLDVSLERRSAAGT